MKTDVIVVRAVVEASGALSVARPEPTTAARSVRCRSSALPVLVMAISLLATGAAWAQDPVPMTMDDGEPATDETMQTLEMLRPMGFEGEMDMESPGFDMLTEVIVTGARRRPRFSSAASSLTLSGEDLDRQVRATLGETLAKAPGVSSTAFGPGVSRPVLRGLQSDRTRLLVDGIQSLDVSNTSPDHAVAINPLAADRIEILRGPATLLYGSGLVGGVVNTEVRRIPRRIPDAAYEGLVSSNYASSSDERSVGARIGGGQGRFAWHVDGRHLRAGVLEIGDFVLADDLRQTAAASPSAEVRALAGLRDRLPNSEVETWDLGLGGYFETEHWDFGASLSRAESLYGLPTRYSLDPAAPAANTIIDLEQTRFDLRGETRIDGPWLESVRFRFGWADYSHDELLDTGERISTFENDAHEGRIEFIGDWHGRWRSSSGGQYYSRDFSVSADAPLLPPTETRQFALFTLHEVDLDPVKLEAGLRVEFTDISASADPALANPTADRDYTSLSASMAGSYGIAPGWTVGLGANYTERAPVVEELFAQGVDPGTQGVLLGNPDLGEETSWGFEALVRGAGPRWSLEAATYFTRFPDYISAAQTGAVVDGLPVFQFLGDAADYYGFEIQAKLDVAEFGSAVIQVDALADYVRATLDNGDPAPRIPPLRVLAGVGARAERFRGRLEVEWTDTQNRVGTFETTTDSFFVTNALIDWTPSASSPASIELQLSNIFDQSVRRHASFLKDYAPVAGRDARITIRVPF